MNEANPISKIRYPNRWRKGTSGNPKGRPKVDYKIRELAKAHTEDAIVKLVEIVTGSNYPSNVETCASIALINVASNMNVMGHFMKGLNMPVWQYLNTPGAHLIGKKETIRNTQLPVTKEPQETSSLPVSDTVRKIIQIREQIKEEIRLAALARKRRTAKRCSG